MRIPRRVPLALKGSGQIAIGLALSGLGTVLMVMLAARGLDERQFSVFMTWWVTVTLLVTVFGVFEVYLARAWMSAVAAREPTRPILSQLAGQAALLVLVLAAVLWGLAEPLADAVFDGRLWVAASIPVFALVGSLQAIMRGVATGQRRFSVVGLQLGIDGMARAGLVALCVLFLPGSLDLMIAAVLLAGLMSVVLAGLRLGRWLAPPHPLARVVPTSPIGWLLAGSVGPVMISNLVSPWYAAVDRGQPALVAGFAAAITLARMPTQFISAAFGPMMAQLSLSVDAGDEDRHDWVLRRALAVAAGLGLVFVLLFVVLGPVVLTIYVGSAYAVPAWVLGMLAAASAGLFFATVEQASLAARERWGTIAMAWVVGAAVFTVVLLLPLPPLLRASLAPALSVGVACGALYFGILRAGAMARSVAVGSS